MDEDGKSEVSKITRYGAKNDTLLDLFGNEQKKKVSYLIVRKFSWLEIKVGN